MFVWRDFKENGKLREEKWKHSIFTSCLVGRKEGKKKLVGPGVFSLDPPKCFLPEIGRKLGGEKLKVWANQNAHVQVFFIFYFLALFLPVFFFLWFLFLWLPLSSSFPFFSFILFHHFFFFFFFVPFFLWLVLFIIIVF